jgi:hypothetical protein
MIDYTEQLTLECMCAHHNAADPELTADLASLIEWVRTSEQAQHGGPPPVFLLCLEQMLLHGCPRRRQQDAARGLVAV